MENIKIHDEAKLRLMFSNGPLLINTEDNHYKFWHYDQPNKIIYWGRIGSKVRSQDASDKSFLYINQKIKEKKSKGYTRIQ